MDPKWGPQYKNPDFVLDFCFWTECFRSIIRHPKMKSGSFKHWFFVFRDCEDLNWPLFGQKSSLIALKGSFSQKNTIFVKILLFYSLRSKQATKSTLGMFFHPFHISKAQKNTRGYFVRAFSMKIRDFNAFYHYKRKWPISPYGPKMETNI